MERKMTQKELKKEYLELLKEELARKEIIKDELSEKIKDKENRYYFGEYDSACKQVISLKHDIMGLSKELEEQEDAYSLDIEEFENIDSFRNWKKNHLDTKIKNIYPAKKILGYEDRHTHINQPELTKIVKGTPTWSETFIYVVYWKKVNGEAND
jgi:hypothetical protein